MYIEDKDVAVAINSNNSTYIDNNKKTYPIPSVKNKILAQPVNKVNRIKTARMQPSLNND